jgi:hypothetical protein
MSDIWFRFGKKPDLNLSPIPWKFGSKKKIDILLTSNEFENGLDQRFLTDGLRSTTFDNIFF